MSDVSTLTGQEFVGHWIGETMGNDSGIESPAHLWEITRSNNTLIIKTRWEGEAAQGGHFSTKVPDQAQNGAASFELRTGQHLCTVVLVDSQHFIIRGWDTNDVRNNAGPDYDVVFSRPGVAELQAQAVWQRHKDHLPEPKPIVKTTREQETAQQWRGMTRSLSQPSQAQSIGGAAGAKARRKK